jgi:hypothetical protein
VIFGDPGVMTCLELIDHIPVASNAFLIFEGVYVASLAVVTSLIEY